MDVLKDDEDAKKAVEGLDGTRVTVTYIHRDNKDPIAENVVVAV